MEILQLTKYKCSFCGCVYESEAEAKECEKKPVSMDMGVKVGDIVLITKGDGAGQKAKVKSVFVYDRAWGHYAWKRYWHTVGLTADVIDSWGTRQLTFDDYEVTEVRNENKKGGKYRRIVPAM